ncbi:hypothetical protein CDAR_581621 [Caerostris darwini]|uniref:DDE-1 domain-containing protein n=1 Tax=Caerostris darwini TaxID=1538125 RepID=A0AAV4X6M0_9ARAC|nr:hypothetical protein CDAR_581621 [Caerostris darwini]
MSSFDPNQKRPEWTKIHRKVLLLNDYTSSHTAKAVRDTIYVLGLEFFPLRSLYSPDLALFDYHLFSIDVLRIFHVTPSTITNMSETSFKIGPPQKMYHFSGWAFPNCDRWEKGGLAMVHTLNKPN